LNLDTSEIRIVSAFAGVGKTTLAAKHPSAFNDLTLGAYKYVIESEVSADSERAKACPDTEMNLDWPNNYIAAIKEVLKSEKTILIPSDRLVLMLLQFEEVPYYLCYPQRKLKEEYQKRYIARGNSDHFLEVFIGGWDLFMDSLESDSYGKHIVLKEGQFLSDIV